MSKIDGVVWNSPPTGWLKENFEGATKGNPGLASCGVILKDCYGNYIVIVASPNSIQTSHVVKAMASVQICEVAAEKGCNKLWLKVDSMNIINCI